MSEPKFTPGPWEQDPTGRLSIDIRTPRLRPAGISFIIATAHGGMPGRETEANARLIAAAPDLYAACESAIESFDALRGNLGPGPGLRFDVIDGAVRILRAALSRARAEGRAS